MLQIKNINKRYVTGDLTQTALNDVSLTLRDNEFVAILGPSGSGKTTLLNIIGGLDRYDDGDLVINGISTKKYSDRDWDSYRNHTIGFVFQGYNLIPHQSILANVELALTISGVSRSERRERAKRALEQVGLGGQFHKKPNQMSGGQMQRVAIARALVNDPDILLADEPTGALDSETSIQVMELIKEIAKSKLVVMVTHNPELAEQYANRVIKLCDGKITDDSNPYEVDEDKIEEPKHKNMGKASMSFRTALSLSFNNLKTKKARTLLTSFAGSIGIIGIALILALSNGIQIYIDSIQRGALTSYPITIESSTMDMTTAMSDLILTTEETEDQKDPNKIYSNTMMNTFMDSFASGMWDNDLKAFKAYIESEKCNIQNYTSSIQYSYDNTMNIYAINNDGEINQVCPSPITSMINDMSMGGVSLDFATLSSYEKYLNPWQELINNQSVLEEQYDLIQGAWPQNYNEVVLILDRNKEISDFVLQGLGVTNAADTMEAFMAMQNGAEYESKSYEFTYDEILNKEFCLVLEPSFYQYDEETKTWIDKHDDEEYTKNLINNAEKIKIVGIIKPSENSTATITTGGIGYTSDLTVHVIEKTNSCEIVKQQKANPNIDVFTGLPFETTIEEGKKAAKEEDTTEVTTVAASLGVDSESAKDVTYPGVQNTSIPTTVKQRANMTNSMFDVGNMESVTEEELYSMIDKTYSGEEAKEIKRICKLVLKTVYTRSDREELAAYFDTILEGQSIEGVGEITGSQAVNYLQMMDKNTKIKMLASIIQSMGEFSEEVTGAEDESITQETPSATEPEPPKPQPFASSYNEALSILGVADLDKPKMINIYPIDFEAKEYISEIVSKYNETAKKEGREDEAIKYTDYVGLMLSSVTTIIDVISYVLVAFVAVSLIVSSIMIGIITYISVLERTKEIGILRAIGSSKRNISQVFNAETFIIGLCSGLIGVTLTELLLIPGNAVIHAITGISSINAVLPVKAMFILVLLSMLLTVIAGLIPSRKAAKKDPVAALRAE